jgi:hypothetical protein
VGPVIENWNSEGFLYRSGLQGVAAKTGLTCKRCLGHFGAE